MVDDPVRRALADLARADASRHAPPHLEYVVLEAFDRRRERGHLLRCAATAWAYRREVVAVVLTVGVTTAIYFNLLDPVFVHPLVPAPPVPSLVRGDRELPAMAGHLDAQESPLTSPPSVPHQAQRPRTPEHRPVQSAVDQAMPMSRKSDDIVHAVHVRLPRAMLPMLGVPIIEPDAAGTVSVEVLLGHDGLARTIRIVR